MIKPIVIILGCVMLVAYVFVSIFLLSYLRVFPGKTIFQHTKGRATPETIGACANKCKGTTEEIYCYDTKDKAIGNLCYSWCYGEFGNSCGY